jgi:hypothetical protein
LHPCNLVRDQTYNFILDLLFELVAWLLVDFALVVIGHLNEEIQFLNQSLVGREVRVHCLV